MTGLIKILVVCTGNLCRSPMAEGILSELARRQGLDRVRVESAGTHAPEGSPAATHATAVLARRGIDLGSHRASLVDRSRVRAADLVLAMAREHRDFIEAQWPAESAGKIRLIREYHPGDPAEKDVADPIGQERGQYEAAARLLWECCEGVIQSLKQG